MFYSNSLDAFEKASDSEPMSWVLNNLGILYTKIRNYDEARQHLERGLKIAIQRNDAVVENVIVLNLAEVWVGLGRLDLADDFCAMALEQAQRRHDHLSAAGALKVRAAIERQRGAADKSIATLRMAIYEAEERKTGSFTRSCSASWRDFEGCRHAGEADPLARSGGFIRGRGPATISPRSRPSSNL